MPGYAGDGASCHEVDACSGVSSPCSTNAKCKPTGPGTYKCRCKKGFEGDGVTCTEVNACLKNPCDTNAKCTSTGPAKYKCKCKKGFRGDGKTCLAINRCLGRRGACSDKASCTMTGPGTYKCKCKDVWPAPLLSSSAVSVCPYVCPDFDLASAVWRVVLC
jgi:hypothetical protein